MAKLTKLEVSFISLVDKPANKKDIVYKCRDRFNKERIIKIEKINDEGLVMGTVYEPNVKDTDGDWADPETIKKAAHDFMRSGKNFNVDADHSKKPIGAAVVESHLDTAGAWRVAIQMDPESETFQKVKKGEYKGLSMMALVQKEEAEPPVAKDSSEGENPALDAKIEELASKIEKQAKTINDMLLVMKAIPKSRQLVIDNDGKVTINKNELTDDIPFAEFDFANLK
ncbi:MAG: XkdF-like putative serine protease domain-containing protein [Candidatus Cloacimonadaceae bacterium]|nr:XkdF-like putative serine protease domain-containing protein [Candidatus Cloacimonadaceae bacterium]